MPINCSFSFRRGFGGWLALACVENVQTLQRSDYLLVQGPGRILVAGVGTESQLARFLPSLIADNEG